MLPGSQKHFSRSHAKIICPALPVLQSDDLGVLLRSNTDMCIFLLVTEPIFG
jgi:hypothetical protein